MTPSLDHIHSICAIHVFHSDLTHETVDLSMNSEAKYVFAGADQEIFMIKILQMVGTGWVNEVPAGNTSSAIIIKYFF